MTACCQITYATLDYRANSYHIHLNTLGFHGCGKEISQICPYLFCHINISFSSTPSPSCHSIDPNLLSWRRQYPRTPRTSTRISSNNPQGLRSLLPSRRNGHQLHRPRCQFIILFLFALLLYSCSFTIPFTEHSFSSFRSFILKNVYDLADKIVIPTDQPHLQCLGPLGNPDPIDLINSETNKIPFRTENLSLDLWKDAFRSWPSPTKG